jgi:streptogramin lyase
VVRLEDRCLLSNVITQFQLPSPISAVSALVAGPDGNLWFTESWTRKIGRMTPAGDLQEFDLPAGSSPIDITAGADGNLWIADNQAYTIDRLTPAGVLTQFHLPSSWLPPGSLQGDGAPTRIAASAHGDLWFTEWNSDKLGRLSVNGQFSEFDLGDFKPADIAVDASDDVWVADAHQARIGRLSDGVFSVVSLPGSSDPLDLVETIAAGPDGSLWFTQGVPGQPSDIGRVSDAGVVTYLGSGSTRIVSGLGVTATGSVWFAELTGVGTIDPTTGVVIDYHIGTDPGAGLTVGADGKLWFFSFSSIQRVDVTAIQPPAPGDMIGTGTQVFTLTVSGLPVTVMIGPGGVFSTSPGQGGGGGLGSGGLGGGPQPGGNGGVASVPNAQATTVLYDPSIRITWNSLTDHGTPIQYVLSIGGISTGTLPRDSVTITQSTTTHFAGGEILHSSGTSATPVIDGLQAAPNPPAQFVTVSTVVQIVGAASDKAGSPNQATAAVSEKDSGTAGTSAFAAGTLANPLPFAPEPTSLGPGVPRQAATDQDLVAVADAILDASRPPENPKSGSRSGFPGNLLRFAATFLLCQTPFWLIALESRQGGNKQPLDGERNSPN